MRILTAKEHFRLSMKQAWKLRTDDPTWDGTGHFNKIWNPSSPQFLTNLSRRMLFVEQFNSPKLRMAYLSYMNNPLVTIRMGKRMHAYPVYGLAWYTVFSRWPDIRQKALKNNIQNFYNIVI